MNKPMKILYIFTVCIMMSLFMFACAIDDDTPSNMGYITCDSDADCEGKGKCLQGKDFKYCGAECTIDDDCVADGDLEQETPNKVCKNNICVDPENSGN